MFTLSYVALAAFGFGLVVTLVLAAWLTPSRWWRQLNVRALAIVGIGTWAIGALVLWLAQPPAQAPLMAATAMAMPMAAPAAGRSYRVHEDLNLREEKGTGARRIAVVPAGHVVTTTGLGDGDWWQVSTRVGGKEVHGWSSSLWLRRTDEPPL
jgi:Na+/melibiose symporter-like transporter